MTNALKTLAKSAFVAAAMAATATSASAFGFDICEDVNITIRNNSSQPIQLWDLDFYDYGASIWRSEPTSNRVLGPGDQITVERNLEGVENANTVVRAYVRILENGRWGSNYYAESNTFTCRHDGRVTVNFN